VFHRGTLRLLAENTSPARLCIPHFQEKPMPEPLPDEKDLVEKFDIHLPGDSLIGRAYRNHNHGGKGRRITVHRGEVPLFDSGDHVDLANAEDALLGFLEKIMDERKEKADAKPNG
jgi:hypothetical protein